MARLFKSNYRVSSSRLGRWNYRKGIYFITISTDKKHPFFGVIENAKGITPTSLGSVAAREWFRIPELRPDMNIELGAFVVMPDHIHGIINIKTNFYNRLDLQPRVFLVNHFGSQSKNLASIIRGYRSSVTMYARLNDLDFQWQAGFYEKMVEDEYALRRFTWYIKNNPEKWFRKNCNPLL